MKNHFPILVRFFLAAFVVLAMGSVLIAQDEENAKDLRPVKNMFESIWLIDDQTVLVPIKGTFEWDFQHRFGTMKNGYEDFFGLYAPSNIRLGFNYVPVQKLMVGFGLTRFRFSWDFCAKYAILQQARKGGSPVSLTYYVNGAYDTRDKSELQINNNGNRFAYFHQLMLARKLTDDLSIQVAGSLTHLNAVSAERGSAGETIKNYENDQFNVSIAARYRVGEWVNLIANFSQPITQHENLDPQSNVAFGLELTSSAHQFQIFVGNYYNILPQQNTFFNKNKFSNQDILIGFNITRLWNF